MTSAEDANWYYTDGSSTFGPFQLRVLQQLVSAGVIGPSALVCQEGGNRWIPSNQIIAAATHVSNLPAVPSNSPAEDAGRRVELLQVGKQSAQRSTGTAAGIGFGLVVLVLIAGAITFWSGRPELLAIVLIGGLVKHLLFAKPNRRP